MVSRLSAVEQLLEIALQLFRILLRRLAIHSHGPVFAHAPMGFVQPFDVDVMRQRPQSGTGHLLGQLRYLLEFR